MAFCICQYPLSGQQGETDSLFNLLNKDNPDTSKVIHLNALGRELMFNNPDTSILLGNEALLLAIQHNSMQEQEKLLDNFIESWKAGTEQIDDILVIGVRL